MTLIESLIRKFFPYPSYRPYQSDAIRFAYRIFANKKVGLLSSPCGTGKSISVLTAYFMAKALGLAGRLFALTRTKSQLEIYCLPPDTVVTADYNITSKIAEITTGNRVLTHRGTFGLVTKVFRRSFKGYLRKIIPYYTNIPLKLTPEHPLLVRVGNEIKWKEARYVKVGDYVAYPRFKETLRIKKILISDIISEDKPHTCDRCQLYNQALEDCRNGLSIKEAATKRGVPYSTVRNWVCRGVKPTCIKPTFRIKDSYVVAKGSTSKPIPNELKIDKNFMRLVGYYVAEGTVINFGCTLCFSFSARELDYIRDVEQLMKSIFGLKPNKSLKSGNEALILFTSKVVATLFKKLFGSHSHLKRLPDWMLQLPVELQKDFIRGYYRGDGEKFSYRNGFRMGTSSKVLAYQLRILLHRFGISHSFYVRRKNKVKPNYRPNLQRAIIQRHDYYTLQISKLHSQKMGQILGIRTTKTSNRASFFMVDKDYIYVKIRKIEEIPYEGPVFNLSINDAESYTANGLVVHNCRELKRIKDHADITFVASMFKSKQEMCPRVKEDSRLRNIRYRDFIRYCRDLKKGVFGRTCEYYDRTYYQAGWKISHQARLAVKKIERIGPLLPDEVCEVCSDFSLCPYEITKILAWHADIIVGNYNYILVPAIRRAILGRAKAKLADIDCVLDEAHSLPPYASDLLSDELSTRSMRRAEKEAKEFSVDDLGLFDELCHIVGKLGKRAYNKYGLDSELVLKMNIIIEPILKKLKFSSFDELFTFIIGLSEAGEQIRWKRLEEGKRPISYLARCSSFLLDWMGTTEPSYVRYVKAVRSREGKRYARIGIKCLDPSLSVSIVNRLRSAVFMSGTLWDMDYYVEVLGINKTRVETMELPSPFPRQNRLILVDRAVTTKYELRGEAQWRKIAFHLHEIITTIDGRVAIYFPSYEVMEAILQKLKPTLPYLAESADTKISQVLNFLTSHDRCLIFGVARGKISEGVDMAIEGKGLLSAVIAVGLPYPKKTELQAALLEYFKEKFGRRAYDYANTVPCINALAQSAGRLIRSPEDKGIIVIMDSRATGKFKMRLPQEWRESMKGHLKIDRLKEKIRKFYRQVKSSQPG